MKRRYFAISTALAIVLGTNCYAKIVASVDPAYPPFALYTKEKKIEGFDVDLMKLLEQEIGEEIEIVGQDYTAALVGLVAGKVDVVSSVTPTDVKKNKVLLTQPVMECGLSLSANKDNNEINSESDIKPSHKVGVIMGTTSVDVAVERFKKEQLVYFEDASIMYESLLHNKIDVVINDSVVNNYYILQQKDNVKIKIISPEFDVTPGVIAVNKKKKSVHERFEAAIAKLEKSGELEDLRKKWFKLK